MTDYTKCKMGEHRFKMKDGMFIRECIDCGFNPWKMGGSV